MEAALAAITGVIEEGLASAGAKKVVSGRHQRMDTREAARRRIGRDPQLKTLVQRRRQARRQGNGALVRALDRQITSLKRVLEKKDKAATQQEVLADWRSNPRAVAALVFLPPLHHDDFYAVLAAAKVRRVD